MEAKQTVGLRIRALRKARHLTLRRFGLMIGMDRTYLSGVENGKRNPTVDTLSKIADGLDVPLIELFRSPGDPLPFR